MVCWDSSRLDFRSGRRVNTSRTCVKSVFFSTCKIIARFPVTVAFMLRLLRPPPSPVSLAKLGWTSKLLAKSSHHSLTKNIQGSDSHVAMLPAFAKLSKLRSPWNIIGISMLSLFPKALRRVPLVWVPLFYLMLFGFLFDPPTTCAIYCGGWVGRWVGRISSPIYLIFWYINKQNVLISNMVSKIIYGFVIKSYDLFLPYFYKLISVSSVIIL